MDCHSHNRTSRAASAVVAAVASLCLAGAGRVSAQMAASPAWSAPTTVWIVPQPESQPTYPLWAYPQPVSPYIASPYAASPQAVWIAPQPSPQAVRIAPHPTPRPAWTVPAPQVTTFFPPADTGLPPGAVPVETVPVETVSGEPPANVHLRITVTGSLLSTLLSREVTDSGPVRDCLMGANLYGDQFTITRLGVDCQPCATHARLLLRLRGLVTDRTVGVTAPASVHSEGSHRFEMTKEVNFDGGQFTTRSPAAWVTPQIVYRDASTVVSGVPVIGPIGTAIALNEAERRRPAVEQFALRRVTRTAAPRFNNEVDEKLSDANRRLSRHVPALLEQLGLTLADQRLSSGSDRLYYGLRLPADSRDEQSNPLALPGESEAPRQGAGAGDQGSGTLSGELEAPRQPLLPEPSASAASPGPVFLESIERESIERESIERERIERERIERERIERESIERESIEADSAESLPVETGDIERTKGTDVSTVDAVAHHFEVPAPSSVPHSSTPAAPPTAEGRSLTILIHEDFVNHLLGRLPLAGQEVPDRLIDRAIETLLDVIAGKSLTKLSPDLSDIPDPEFATILLDQDRPLSIRFGESRAVLTLRAGFRPVVGGEIPTQRVEIPFEVSREEHQVTLEPQTVTVESASEDDSGPLAGSLAGSLAGLARPVVRQQVQQRLRTFVLKDAVPLTIPGMRATTLSVRDVILEDGWLAITFD